MTNTAKSGNVPEAKKVTKHLDALVMGTGVAGLYQLHQLRKMGLNVEGCDAASDVGGTWYWNRYPGAKFDSEGFVYQYFFDESLYKGWTWSERFPSQPEIERWLHYVTDRLDLRRSITFNTVVQKATYHEDTCRWTVETSLGDVIDTKYLVACTGMLSAPLEDRFPGQSTFIGQIVHTARYPKEGLALQGKRVGVIGTGATGIQVIQTIAPQVDALKVFVRTPQFVLPMINPKYGPVEVKEYKEQFSNMAKSHTHTFAGFQYDFGFVWGDLSPEERLNVMEDTYQHGSLKLWLGCFAEMFFEQEINDEVSAFVRAKMVARLKDQSLIDALVPQKGDYGFGTHRVPLECSYLETYLRDNVEAISVRDNAITEIVPEGIKLADGTVHEVDVIVMAVGFDAGSGALSRIDISGRDNLKLGEEWAKEIRTTLGMQKYGFPNLFMTGAPLAPSAALCNMTTCLQQQTEWISQCIGHLEETGHETIEPTLEGEDHWVRHHDELANATLLSKTDSWYNGANVEGKPKGRVLSYCGGVGGYRQQCDEVVQGGYSLFKLSKAEEKEHA